MKPSVNQMSRFSNTDCLSISNAFLRLHEKSGFKILPPSSLLHPSVPMSFVMSAGLIQIENNLDQIVEQTGGKFVFNQPCFRYFDVKQVGEDTTHLSLFDMAAAFHVGCSERETVLPRLWAFLTKTLGFEARSLWVTYLDDPELGQDKQTYNCWRDIGVNEDRLIGLNQEHCFWKQSNTGQIASDGKKCGPHSEIFVERLEVDNSSCSCSQLNPGLCQCGRFVEVSNSLFIENYISAEGKLVAAGTVFAECVIGVERLAMILQGVRDVHHVDRFDVWREKLESLLQKSRTPEIEISMNIILDHLSAFLILSRHGAPIPGRGGRKYLMRKLVRGAMQQILILDMNIEKVFEILVSGKEKEHFHALIDERDRFIKTLLSEKYREKLSISNTEISFQAVMNNKASK